jgi:hypothetical protein
VSSSIPKEEGGKNISTWWEYLKRKAVRMLEERWRRKAVDEGGYLPRV